MEPVVVFFLLGVAGGLLRTDLKFPPAFFDALTIYLLLAIGLKGGVELAKHPLASAVLPAALALPSATAGTSQLAVPPASRFSRASAVGQVA